MPREPTVQARHRSGPQARRLVPPPEVPARATLERFQVFALAMTVYRNRRLVSMLNRPDDIFGPERCITAEEHTRQG